MTDRKNILLVSLDDSFAYWKYQSAFGVTLQTPNLDRICAASTVFQNAYCQVPVCGPSRSSFMSGLAPHQLGIFDNYTSVFDVLRPEQMWPFKIKQAGYDCSNAGKVHHRYKPLPDAIHNVLYSHGSEYLNIGPGKNAHHKTFGGMMKGFGTTDPKYDKRYYDAQSAASTMQFLQTYDGADPFYREAGFYHPHSPYKTPVRFKEMYPLDQFHQPDDWATGYDKNAFAEMFMQENMDASNLDTWRKSVRNYFSALSHVDEHLGKVWDALQASDHAKNTVMMIVADHGYHPGDKNRFRKLTLWEEAAGVPMIIHDPDSAPQVVEVPVALLDVGPTLLDYAGCLPIQNCAGQSLRPQVEGATVVGRAVPTFFFGCAAIRQGNYRYILYQDGSRQLYDITKDLWQLRDLAGQGLQMEPALHLALIETCRTYGLDILDTQNAVATGANYTSIIGATSAPTRAAGDGTVVLGSMIEAPAEPGVRKQFALPQTDGVLPLPATMRAMYLAADYRFGVDYFGIVGNDQGNHMNFVGGHDRFLLDIDCGDGDDKIHGHLDRLRVRLNAGTNTVITGHTGAEVFGGAGRDQIETANGTNIIHGGDGDMLVKTGDGVDTVFTGHGQNKVVCLGGSNHVTFKAGQTDIVIKGGDLTLTAQRTGLPQTVHGFTEGKIDLSDWSMFGSPDVYADGGDTIVQAGPERICFHQCAPDIVQSSIVQSDA